MGRRRDRARASGARHEPRWRRSAAQPAEVEPCESDAERDDDGLPESAPLGRRIGRLKTIIEGAGTPEPPPPLRRAERRALDAQRAERARRAASPYAPDEPWDVLGAADKAPGDKVAGDKVAGDKVAGDDPPWRGSG
jgi:hypothetical protein